MSRRAAAQPLARDIEALLAFIETRQTMPHQWGRHANDCCSFALAAAKAQTGHDRATRLKWTNREQAVRVIARLGGLEAAIDRYFHRIAPAHAMRGDIGGVPSAEFGVHPMIIEGDMLVGPTDGGLLRVRRRAMTVAWSVVLPVPRRKTT